MIYLVTTQNQLLDSSLYKVTSVEESLRLLNTITNVGLDIETDGLDPHLKNLLLLQLGNKDFQVVIDCTTIDILKYKDYLEDPNRTFIGWNLKFDLQFLYNYEIIPRNIHDGFIAEKLIWFNYPDGVHSLSLQTACEYYLGRKLNKEVRETIGKNELNKEIIQYAAKDVKYLEEIMLLQKAFLKSKGQSLALELENKVVPVTAYFEYCGVKIDVDKWKAKMEKDQALVDSTQKELDDFVVKLYLDNVEGIDQFIDIIPRDLFNDNEIVYCSLNWNSPKQVIALFELLGFNLVTKDEKKGGLKKSVGEEIINKQAQIHPIANLYLEYKKAQKLIGTYGQGFLDLINPVTGRIHTSFNQIGTDTYRFSSGKGSNKELIPGKSVSLVNLQNLPATEETRSCFIAERGNKWISIDYSGEESIILANISRDEAMIDLFLNGCGDLHSLVAKMIYKEELKDIPVEKVKELRPDLRKKAKSPEFTFAYGGSSHTLIKKDNIPPKEALEIENNYKEGFKGVALYQNTQRELVLKDGVLDTCPEVGYKYYVRDFNKLIGIHRNLHLMWSDYLRFKDTNPENTIVQTVKYFLKKKSTLERRYINYPIQTRGSAILKIALVNFFWWVVRNGYFKKVLFCINAHDELNNEAPEEIAELVATTMHKYMVDAGKFICKIVPLDAEISRLSDGTLPNYWIH